MQGRKRMTLKQKAVLYVYIFRALARAGAKLEHADDQKLHLAAVAYLKHLFEKEAHA